ncbi:MAG: hypothetical protein Greene101449_647 [Candidatus Peregrinibacteria bacterium Greene1014_49]|nr:MAG: hypothetical protein Greene101449_647 [Candidatus Peregrinibacteria bacterium Greene1014_49]
MLTAGDSGRTFICSRTRDRDALIGLADHVAGTAAAEDQCTLVSSRTGKGNTGIASALGVIAAANAGSTFVGAWCVHGNALLLVVAFRVLLTASKNRIAGVGTRTREVDASSVIGSAFGVLIARNHCGAFVSTRGVDRDALILGIAFHVLRAAPEDGITGVLCVSREDDAGSVIRRAFAMFSTLDHRRAFVGTRGVHGNTLIILAFHVLLAAAENGITFVLFDPGEDDAGSVIGGAFGVFTAVDERRAIICTSTFIHETDISGVITDKVLCSITVSILQAFVRASSW